MLSPLTEPQKGQSSGIAGTCMRADVHQPFKKVLIASNLEVFFSSCKVARTSSVLTATVSPKILVHRWDMVAPIKKGAEAPTKAAVMVACSPFDGKVSGRRATRWPAAAAARLAGARCEGPGTTPFAAPARRAAAASEF